MAKKKQCKNFHAQASLKEKQPAEGFDTVRREKMSECTEKRVLVWILQMALI